MRKKTTTIGLYLLDRLASLGVKHIFGIPGDYIIRFNKLIEEHPIQFINTTRENTAGYMADAYARIKGLGVACITYGVGINIANAISQAYVESSPLVVISGAASTQEAERCPTLHHMINEPSNGFDTTQLEIFQRITIAQTVLNDPVIAADEIDRVLHLCMTHRKPVYIELPRDRVVQPIPIRNPNKFPLAKSDKETLSEVFQEVTTILKASRHPVIWAGHEIRGHKLAAPMLRFAEKHHIPIVSTLLGKTVIDEHHPLFAGVYQGEISPSSVKRFTADCDCALILGALLNDIETGIFTAKLDQEKRIYASPTQLTIGHHSYDNVQLADFINGLVKLPLKKSFKQSLSQPSLRSFVPKQKAHTTTKRLFECIQSHLKPNHIVVSDIGDCLFGASELVLPQNAFMACAHFASLSFATPATMGVQLAEPRKRVICVVGDGAFQMTSMELSTAVRYHLDPVVIVLNNHGYGMERPILEGSYNEIQNWNYSEIPRVLCGGVGVKVTNELELDEALTQALKKRGTFYIIEVELAKTDFSPALKRLCEMVSKRV